MTVWCDDNIWRIANRCQGTANVRVDDHWHQDRDGIELHHLAKTNGDRSHEQNSRHIVQERWENGSEEAETVDERPDFSACDLRLILF